MKHNNNNALALYSDDEQIAVQRVPNSETPTNQQTNRDQTPEDKKNNKQLNSATAGCTDKEQHTTQPSPAKDNTQNLH